MIPTPLDIQARQLKKGKLVKMYIYIYDRGKDGKYYDPYRVLNISIHEFGHALGIGGHSNDSSSIMYPLMNPDKEKKIRLYFKNGYKHGNSFI